MRNVSFMMAVQGTMYIIGEIGFNHESCAGCMVLYC